MRVTVPDEDFLDQVAIEILLAVNRVTEQSDKGENQFLPIMAMWPHGIQDLLGVIFTKSARAVGYEMSHDLGGVYAEAQEILNYASFLLAYLKITEYNYAIPRTDDLNSTVMPGTLHAEEEPGPDLPDSFPHFPGLS